MADENKSDITALTVQLLSAFVSKNTVSSESLAELIKTTRAALTEEPTPAVSETRAQEFVPAVSVRKSLSSPDHIISLIDGKPYKTLKRHLATHGLTPEQYRERYKLPKSYPLVATSYSDARRAVAQRLGLGRKAAASSVATNPSALEAPAAESKSAPAAAKAAKPKAPPASAEKAEVKAPAAAKAAPRKRLSIASAKEEKSSTPAVAKAEKADSVTNAPQSDAGKATQPKASAAKAKPASNVKAAAKPKSSKANTKAAAANIDAKAPEPATN
jgi:predicted transcriptional regulator